MNETYKVAAIQMVSTPEVEENFAAARRLVGQAAEQGAQLVLLPEYWPIMAMHEKAKLAHAEQTDVGKIQDFMVALASEFKVWLVGGTLPMASDEADKVLNTTMVYDPAGRRVARYDKIHLFSFVRGEEAYDEARTIVFGNEVGGFTAPFGKVGLSICYDLRFPELYRAMGDCALIVVPAAFTHTTGQAHWETLLRARAIENQAYVLAPAQGGQHPNGRHTWGHSLAVDPWGQVLDMRDQGAGLVLAELERKRLAQVRAQLPALQHRIL